MAFGSSLVTSGSNSMLSSMQQMSLDDKPDFVIKLSGKYVCTYCNQGLRPPVKQTACGHRLCDLCVQKLRSEQQEPSCPGREEGCVPLVDENIYPDRGTDRELSNMEVHCPNRPRCHVTPKWRVLNKHILEECKFNIVSCPNAVYGCNVTFLQSEKEDHVRQCIFNPKVCRYCNEEFPGIKLKEHELKCKEEIISCSFSEEGCSFRGNRKDVYDHIHNPEAIANHLDKTMRKLREERKRTAALSNQVQSMEKEKKQMQTVVTEVQADLKTFKEQVLVDHDEMQQQLTGQAKQAEECLSYTQKPNYEPGILKQIDERIAVLESVATTVEDNGSRIVGISEDETKTIKSNERMVAMHDVTLAEHEIRFRCLETTNYKGVLVWKITNYQSRKRAAVDGRTLSIYSQPFYTDPYGYKMCARIYLDGDGMGKSTHASLYFVVMKGEYDSLLPWPFRQRVTMILMDQESGRKHIRDTFRPDPTSTSFRRPATTMNVASGSPLFVAQSVLESPTYLRDDTIYIMIRVDLSDLNHFGLSI